MILPGGAMDMAANGFTRKKVGSLTLGEKLLKFRTDHRTSLLEVSRATKIQVKYLECLENGQYDRLPAEVYVRGFLRSYARHLGCDEEAILRLYERERNIQESLGKTAETAVAKRIEWPSFVITMRTLWGALIIIVIGGAFLYLANEYRTFVSVPRLIIREPVDQGIVSQSDIVVRGETDSGSRILINGQPAFVDTDGHFVEKILLQPGLNTISISAANRFGKERTEILHVEAVFASEQAVLDESPSIPQDSHPVRLVVSAPQKMISVTIIADGAKVFSGKLEPGEKRDVSVDREIRISSDNGKETYVEIGSEAPRALSSEEQPIKDVVFAPE